MDNPVVQPMADTTVESTPQKEKASKTDPLMEDLLSQYNQYFD